ncbi:MAG: hypothetical protein ABIJ41_01315 [Candidatus Omnitrophota bacterium]
MKMIIVLIFALLTVGCAYVVDDVKDLVKDPHYTAYQQQMDNLESSYLSDELSYPEYLKRKQHLEDNYSKEVEEREQKIHDTQNR